MYITVLSLFKLNVVVSICQDTIGGHVLTDSCISVLQHGQL